MAEIATLTAEPRERVGKGSARAVRRAGLVPGVVYGDKKDPIPVSLERRVLDKELQRGGFFSRLYELKVGDATVRVLPRDVQFHPVTDAALHADFLRVSADTVVHVDVPVHFLNQEGSPGIKAGGVLNVVRHTIEMICTPDRIPASIDVDLTGRRIGDSIHISHVALPEGVRPAISDRDFTIATVAAPSAVRAEAQEAAAAAAAGVAEPAAAPAPGAAPAAKEEE